MQRFAAGLLFWFVAWVPLAAQDRDRSLERISIALQQPIPLVREVAPFEIDSPKTFGIFTLVQPTSRGELIRISIPIGELVTRPFKAVAAANQRRQEAAARRRVAAALKWLEQQQPSPKR